MDNQPPQNTLTRSVIFSVLTLLLTLCVICSLLAIVAAMLVVWR